MARGGRPKGRRKRGKDHNRETRQIKQARRAAREAVEQKERTVARRRAQLDEIKADAEALGDEVPPEMHEKIAERERWVAEEEAIAKGLRAELTRSERRAQQRLSEAAWLTTKS